MSRHIPLKPLSNQNLLPEQDRREASLFYVMAVLCFLACLAALVVVASDRAAAGWARDIRAEVTFLVRPSGLESGSVAAAKAAEVLAGVKGVVEAKAVEHEKAKDLIRGWLGDAILDDLPIPNLVEVRLDEASPATSEAMKLALEARQIDAELDDHSIWLKDVEQSALIIRLIAIGIFLILGSAAAAVVSFATRAGLAARSVIVEVLSLCGATDLFIAERFQWRFAQLAAIAGACGMAAAGLVLVVLKATGPSQSFALALPFSYYDLLFILPCPFFMAFIAALTARLVTVRLLGQNAG